MAGAFLWVVKYIIPKLWIGPSIGMLLGALVSVVLTGGGFPPEAIIATIVTVIVSYFGGSEFRNFLCYEYRVDSPLKLRHTISDHHCPLALCAHATLRDSASQPVFRTRRVALPSLPTA